MAPAVPSSLPMKLWRSEPRGKAAAALIRVALGCYAREGRMPLLGTDPVDFVLSTANGATTP